MSPGIILMAVITGLVNISNTDGAICTDVFYPQQGAGGRVIVSQLCDRIYDADNRTAGGIRFSPFVSSIGSSTETGHYTRRSFIYGSAYLPAGGAGPALTRLFSSIPLPVSSAVMLVLIRLYSFPPGVSQQITFTARNILSTRIAVICRIFFKWHYRLYPQYFPLTLRPLLSNGLLVGFTGCSYG
ncbi:solute carrier family 23 protein [Shigella flexneri]